MNLIRIAIGNSEQDKETFVDKVLNIYPENSAERLGIVWTRWAQQGVLQVLMDVDTTTIIATMGVNELGQYWHFNGDYLRQVPDIDKFIEDPSSVYHTYNKSDGTSSKYMKKEKKELSKSEINERIDNILDFIAENGYDQLSQDKKDFLKEYSQ